MRHVKTNQIVSLKPTETTPTPGVGNKKEVENSLVGFSSSTDVLITNKSCSLKSTREIFLPKLNKWRTDIDDNCLEDLENSYFRWLNEPLYISFENEVKFKLHKASKRGNNVYNYQLERRLNKAVKFFDDPEFEDKFSLRIEKHKLVSNVLFMVLTFNPQIDCKNRSRSWEFLPKRYNNFTTKLRQTYGNCWILRSNESYESGFPHINVLVIFDKPFEVFQHIDKKGKVTYRVKNKKVFEKAWNYGFIDIQVPYSIQQIKNYIFKDVFKQFSGLKTKQCDLSLTFNWLFRLRSFSVSNDGILKKLFVLFNSLSLTQREQIENYEKKGFKFLGFVCVWEYRNKIPPTNFEIDKTPANIEEMYSHIFGGKFYA